MKHRFTLLMFILSFLLLPSVWQFLSAQKVTISEARIVAKNFYYEKTLQKQNSTVFSEEIPYFQDEENLFYVFNIESEKGFVIVGANQKIVPIIAYNTTGYFSKTNQSPALKSWLSMYEKEIKFAMENIEKSASENLKTWENYLKPFNEFRPKTTTKAIVGPLFGPDGSGISWNQSPYYNDDCPGSPLSVTGCVATAMSQIMVYHDFPINGIGYREYNHTTALGYGNDFGTLSANFASTTYNIAGMPNSISSANADVARLCFHAGVSVLMDYDDLGSAASSIDAANALITNWDYNKNLEYKRRSAHVDWDDLVRTEIDANRPLLYRGTDDEGAGGHAWVCDGYDDSNSTFHMNWGWGGSDNGFYTLSTLPNPSQGGGYNFQNDQAAIFGITPNNSTTKNLVWEDFEEDGDPYISPDWNRDADGDASLFGFSSTSPYSGAYKLSNGGKQNQWLVSPKIGLPENSIITLSLYGSRLNDRAQTIEVFISTTGTTVPTDFGTAIATFTLNAANNEWNLYSCDLSAYANQQVYLAIRATGNDETNSYVFIDDLSITAVIGIPVVSTQNATNITVSSVTANGTIISLGSENITQYGFCWNTTGNPTILDEKTENGTTSTTGTYTNSLSLLPSGTTFFIKAYAINNIGTSYGEEVTFTTLSTTTWINPGMWENGVPNQTTHAVIDTLYNILTNIHCNNLTINQGAKLVIQPGSSVTVEGNLTNNDTIILISPTDLSPSGSLITNGTIDNTSGTMLAQRWIAADRWHLISSPLNTSFNAINSFNQINVYRYNEAAPDQNAAWTALVSNSQIVPGTGYLVKSQSAYLGATTIEFDGTFQTGTQTYSNLAYANTILTRRGFNLVANPYPSAIDWNAGSGWTKTNITGTTWIWNAGENGYATWDGTVGVRGGSRYIPAMQGYFIQTLNAINTLEMNNEVRVHNNENFKSVVPDLLRLTTEGNDLSDEIVLYYAEDNADSRKMFSWTPNVPSIYTIEGEEKLAINKLQDIKSAQTIEMGFNCQLSGTYSIKAEEFTFTGNTTVVLEDLITNIQTNLSTGASYTFAYTTGSNENRFRLYFNYLPTNINQLSSNINIYSVEKTIFINEKDMTTGTIKVYNQLGQVVLIDKIKPEIATNLPTGIYIVKVENNKQVITKQIFIK